MSHLEVSSRRYVDADSASFTKSNPTLTTTLRVLSYNFFLRPPLVSQTNGGDFKEARLQVFIDTVLPNYDLIALQEAFTSFNSRVDTLFKHARNCGFQTCTAGPHRCLHKLQLVDSGLVLLSTWQTVTKNTCVFPSGIAADRLSAKGVLYTKLKHPSQDRHLHVFNTHLQASYTLHPPATHPTVRCRATQLATLQRFIRATVAQDASPILLVGDFNIDRRDPDPHEYRTLLQTLSLDQQYTVTDALATAPSDHAYTHRSWRGADDSAHLDYLFLLTPVAPAWVGCHVADAELKPFEMEKKAFPRLSDHSAISANLIFTAPGKTASSVLYATCPRLSETELSGDMLASQRTKIPGMSKSGAAAKAFLSPLVIPKTESVDHFVDAKSKLDIAE